MSWSADYRLPDASYSAERLRALVAQRAARLPGGALAYFTGGGDHLAAGVTFRARSGRAYQGNIEWTFHEPSSELEVEETTAREIDEQLRQSEEEDEPAWEGHRWVPREYLGFVEASWSSASVIGEARGVLRVGPGWADVTEVIPQEVVSDQQLRSEPGGLAGILRQGDTEWAHGYPAFLLRRDGGGPWQPLSLAFPEESCVTNVIGVLPRSATERWLLTDGGSVWRHDDSGALERLADVPDSEDPTGGTPPWSLVARGDEVWLANGSAHLRCLRGGRVTRVAPHGADGSPIHRLVLGGDGRLWAASYEELWVGDGGRLEKALDLQAQSHSIEALLAVRGGALVHSRPTGGQREKRPPRLTRLVGIATEAIEVAGLTGVTSAAVASDDHTTVWFGRLGPRWPQLTRVELPRPPTTRMTVRSSRDDNREEECWNTITSLAGDLCEALGGTDVTR